MVLENLEVVTMHLKPYSNLTKTMISEGCFIKWLQLTDSRIQECFWVHNGTKGAVQEIQGWGYADACFRVEAS